MINVIKISRLLELGFRIEEGLNIHTFFVAYVQSALFHSTDESTDTGGYPLDKNYSFADIAEESLTQMGEDCLQFLSNPAVRAAIETRTNGYEKAGNDFWLTRNRSGGGFWDGDWPTKSANFSTHKTPHLRWEGEAGDFLTAQAHEAGEASLYAGDDGKIYLFHG